MLTGHDDLPDAQHGQHVPMAPGVFPHAFLGVDDQHRGLGPGGPGDHVLQELDVARGVDDDVVPVGRFEEAAGGIDGDALGLLGLRASRRKAYSKGLALRAHSARTCSSLPSGREPVSAKSRPMTVDLPWSTWPTTTILNCSRPGAWGHLRLLRRNTSCIVRIFESFLLIDVDVFHYGSYIPALSIYVSKV